MAKKLKILFLCTGNSCRSQMAEGWARHLKSDSIQPVDPEDIEAMALALERLWTDDAWLNSLQTKGYQQAQRFNWDNAAKQTLELYHSLLS